MNQFREAITLNNQESEEMKLKIKKLVSENSFLMDEQKIAQENLRLSNAQQQKILNEYNEYKGVIMQN